MFQLFLLLDTKGKLTQLSFPMANLQEKSHITIDSDLWLLGYPEIVASE